MKYLTVRSEERASIEQFRSTCLSENLHIVLRKRAIVLLQHIVEGNDKQFKAPQQHIQALLRRGFIRTKGKGWVHTELGLLALAFAVAGGIIRQSGDADVVKIADRKQRKEA